MTAGPRALHAALAAASSFRPGAVLATGPRLAGAPEEEVLAVREIQGNVLPGFGTRFQTLLGLKIGADPSQTAAARRWLAALAPHVTSLQDMNAVREVRRAVARHVGERPILPDVLLNVALSFPGLGAVGLETSNIDDVDFRVGMGKGAATLGDPVDANGVPTGWTVGATPGTTPDVLLIAGSDDESALATIVASLIRSVGPADPSGGLTLIHRDDGNRLPDNEEHFGFRDNISNPGPRGRLSENPTHFLTRRYIDPADPRAALFGKPGQPLVWPGQYVFGYATHSINDPLVPGRKASGGHPWMDNGSFLVFRRLRQDVPAFRAFAEAMAAQLSGTVGRPLTGEDVQAMIVGRWKDGTPLAVSPLANDPKTAGDEMAVNFFGYNTDSAPMPIAAGDGRPARVVAGPPGDPFGARCPRFAHVRKVNPRDRTTDLGPPNRTRAFQMLRRGIPFGPPFAEGERAGIDRGLLFLSYQTSIVRQFRVLNSNWMNNPHAPESGGNDLLVGQDHARGRGCTLSDARGLEIGTMETKADWVIPTGGGFFFSPAISVLAGLAGPGA